MNIIIDITIVIIEYLVLFIVLNYGLSLRKTSIFSIIYAIITPIILCFAAILHLDSTINLIISIVFYTAFCFLS